MKHARQITLDRAKLLGFRKLNIASDDKASLKRAQLVAIGIKAGVKAVRTVNH